MKGGRMNRSNAILASLFAFGSLLAAGAVTATNTLSVAGSDLDSRLEYACHRQIAKRAPEDIRSLQTLDHEMVGTIVAVASGNLEIERAPGYWSSLKWTCRIDVETAEILRVEFKRPLSSPRFSALAQTDAP